MDNRDIFALCEDNLIYDYLKDAINRDLLVLSYIMEYMMRQAMTKLDTDMGNMFWTTVKRNCLGRKGLTWFWKNISYWPGLRHWAFIKHAEYMADYFNERGVSAACVHSGVVSSQYY